MFSLYIFVLYFLPENPEAYLITPFPYVHVWSWKCNSVFNNWSSWNVRSIGNERILLISTLTFPFSQILHRVFPYQPDKNMSMVGSTGALLDSFLTTWINQMADSSLSCYISVCRRNQRIICARGLQTWSVNQWLNFYSVISKCQLTHRPLKQANKKKSHLPWSTKTVYLTCCGATHHRT